MSKFRGHSMGTFNACVTCGNWGKLPRHERFTLRLPLRPFLTTNTILLVLPACSLHVHMKAIAHANNQSLTLAKVYIIFFFSPDTIEFYVCIGRGMPWCSYAKPVLSSPESYSGICNYIFIGASLGEPQIINVPVDARAVCLYVCSRYAFVRRTVK